MKILLLTSSSGGGHDMRARSFEQWARAEMAAPLGLGVIRRQALEECGGLFAFGSALYNWIQRYWPALHHVYFNVLEVIPFCGSLGAMPGREAFQEYIRREAPDIVISTHDHLNHVFFAAARAALPEHPPRCGTYCGELAGGYGFSKHWVNPAADFFIGAVDACTEQARRLGMAEEKSWTGGFMLNPDFWTAPIDAVERATIFQDELRLDPGRFTVILATGANGANNHLALLDHFFQARVHPQIIALCGKNETVRAELETWAQSHRQIPLCALPYQSRMKRIMECADVIFARPGTGTTSETIQAGLPIVFNGIGGVMPQEIITLRYCRRFFETLVARRASALPPLIDSLMRDRNRWERLREGVVSARPAGTPLRILQELAARFAGRESAKKASKGH